MTTKRKVSRKEFDVLFAQAETDVQPRFRDFFSLERGPFALSGAPASRRPAAQPK